MSKINAKTIALLAGSVFIDAVQGVVLFNAALCAVPSVTGVGVVATLICGAAILGIGTLGSLFSIAWGALAYFLTKEKMALGVGVAEAIPGLNGLPIFTAATLYYMLR